MFCCSGSICVTSLFVRLVYGTYSHLPSSPRHQPPSSSWYHGAAYIWQKSSWSTERPPWWAGSLLLSRLVGACLAVRESLSLRRLSGGCGTGARSRAPLARLDAQKLRGRLAVTVHLAPSSRCRRVLTLVHTMKQ